MKTYRPEYPNPQFEREDFINLNGEWEFEIDNSESAVERGIYDRPLESKINVPFCPESELSGIGNKDFMKVVFYRKTVNISKSKLKNKRVFIHFGACDFETEVRVNKQSVGKHVGGYVSFAFDITKYVKEGENVIEVRAYDDTRSFRQGSGKQSTGYFSRGCNYTRTTGIWQTVWLEFTPENYIKAVRIYPNVNDCSATLIFDLCGKAKLSAKAFYGGKEVGASEQSSAEYSSTLKINLSEKHLWELSHGRLYDLELTFGSDKVKSYFGLRSVSLDDTFKLNGKTVFQRLVLDQGFYPEGIYTAKDEEQLKLDIVLSMNAGFNGARLHEKVFEPRFLYNCDKLGYMVWGEWPNWGLGHHNAECLETFLPEWLEVMARDFNHPSIIGWCPFNETWNQAPTYAIQRSDVLKIAYMATKAFDITRPCIDVSGNYHVITDIYDIHDYEQDVAVYKERYAKLNDDGVLYDKYDSRQHWKGEPLFVSEYGGIGLHIEAKTDEQWCYGNAAKSYEEFYERYDGLTSSLMNCGKLIGFCYTQLYDVEQEQNGLYTYAREPKVDISKIKEINTRKAAIEK
ncbi:MAG: beta-galactosidase [Clostridiales bacterium]|nr:beta-galactosidase [Clostridiales bacterium]